MITFVKDTKQMGKELDFNALGAQVLEEIKNGKPMFGKDDAFAPILEKILNAAFEVKIDSHLTEESRQNGNSRNGKMDFTIETDTAVFFQSPQTNEEGNFLDLAIYKIKDSKSSFSQLISERH